MIQCDLFNVKKPYQYIGKEYLSYNKDFDKAKVKLALAFPDKYEIAISNLGQKILYDIVNSDERFMADRIYAPDFDYRNILLEKNIPLYGLESKKEANEFDIIGFSVTAADPKPFHSMASHRTKGAKQALWLLKNADRVANFCNDVVGDICGIVSGTTAAVIVVQLQEAINYENILFSIVITALISGMTIGGKAAGKEFAMKKCTRIVYTTAKVMLFFGIGKSKNKRR